MMTLADAIDHVRGTGRAVSVRCPAHADRHPSLRVSPGRDGRVLLRCWAGCATVDVLAAVGLRWRDVFAAGRDGRRHGRRVAHGDRERALGAWRTAHICALAREALAWERVAREYGRVLRRHLEDGDRAAWGVLAELSRRVDELDREIAAVEAAEEEERCDPARPS